jgi:hypothetical protein
LLAIASRLNGSTPRVSPVRVVAIGWGLAA